MHWTCLPDKGGRLLLQFYLNWKMNGMQFKSVKCKTWHMHGTTRTLCIWLTYAFDFVKSSKRPSQNKLVNPNCQQLTDFTTYMLHHDLALLKWRIRTALSRCNPLYPPSASLLMQGFAQNLRRYRWIWFCICVVGHVWIYLWHHTLY